MGYNREIWVGTVRLIGNHRSLDRDFPDVMLPGFVEKPGRVFNPDAKTRKWAGWSWGFPGRGVSQVRDSRVNGFLG